jgi:hypothetical protein
MMYVEQPNHAESIDADKESAESAVAPVSETSDDQASALALSVSLSLAHQFPWVGPLVEAALVCPPERRKPLQILTLWGGFPAEVGQPAGADEEKHRLYVAHILKLFDHICPWLLPLLNASHATLLVHPGECRYTVIADPSWDRPFCAFDIPQLIPFTRLTPFPAEAADLIH